MKFPQLSFACLFVTTTPVLAAATEQPASPHERALVPLFADSPVALDSGSGLMRGSVTFASSATGAIRPMAANQVAERAVLESGGWVGVGRNITLTLRGMSDRLAFDAAGHSGTMIGIGWLASQSPHHRLSISSGYLRELLGAQGIWSRVSAEFREDRLVVTAMAHSEHMFAPGRDAIDLVVMAGCYYQASRILRLSAEYVGQDLEGWFDPQEIEGTRQFAGPVVALNDPSDGIGAVIGPAWGVAGNSSMLITRVAAVYAF
jgi:hypothetical protein